MKKCALVTGASGFTGRYMVEELSAAGYDVVGLASDALDDSANYISADLTDHAQLIEVITSLQPDLVVHLAAIAFVGHGDASAFYNVNLIGTQNLLEALCACEKKPEAVLLASSANVYGNQSSGILSETALPNPANDYAVSKTAMEYMARLWMDKLPIVIARPFNYTGIGQDEKFLLPKIVSHFRRKAPVIELGNLDVSRDFSDVRSVVNAYLKLLESCPQGETFNVASGSIYSLLDIVQICTELTGHNIEVTVNPDFVRPNEIKKLGGDASKLTGSIGDWKKTELRETLSWMLFG